MTRAIERVVTVAGVGLAGLWTGAKLMLDWLGRIEVATGLSKPEGLVARGLTWLFQTPAWVPGVIAVVLTTILIWLIWPQANDRTKSKQSQSSPCLYEEKFKTGLYIARVSVDGPNTLADFYI